MAAAGGVGYDEWTPHGGIIGGGRRKQEGGRRGLRVEG
jgi:hypothetical protein